MIAVVVAGARPGEVDTLAPVGGIPMVARAVRCLLATALVDHVVVIDAPARRAAVLSACAGLPVSTPDDREVLFPLRKQAGPRPGHSGRDGPSELRSGDVVLVHDAARPLAPADLATSVVTAVRPGCPVVVPVLPLSDTVKQVDGAGVIRATPDRAGLRVLQSPHALCRELLDGVLAEDVLATAGEHAAGGGEVRTVPGHPMAFPVRSAWDLQLVELLVRGGAP